MIEEGRSKVENDSKLFTGIACFPQGVQNEKKQMRERCIQSNMLGATLRFEKGLEQAREWEAQKDYE